MLQWNKKFETGHEQIDSEHKMLIEYINRLEDTSRFSNPTRQEIESILSLVDFVQAYTVVHFQHEEDCMTRHQCPARHENQEAHRSFLRVFEQFKERFTAAGCRPETLEELHTLCSNWVKEHILNIDVCLRTCLPAPAQAQAAEP